MNRVLAGIIILGVLIGPPWQQATRAHDPPAQAHADRAQVARWVAALGAPAYRDREDAEAALRGLGLEAFELLSEYADHDEMEVRLRVRAVLHGLRGLHLFHDIDPLLLLRLKGYENLGRTARLTRVSQLGNWAPQQGIDALTRIARFDEDELISKQAALEVLQSQMPTDPDRIRTLCDLVERNEGASTRPAVKWLHEYLEAWRDPASAVDRWEKILAQESKQFAENPERSSDAILRGLKLTLLDAQLRAHQIDAAKPWIDEFSQHATRNREFLSTWLVWLLHRQQGNAVVALREDHKELFDNNPLALYLVAEAQLRNQQKEAAEATILLAQKAVANSDTRRIVAQWLDGSRGQFDWAEHEFRRILEIEPIEAPIHWMACKDLSEMLHDLQRDLEAGQVLQTVVDACGESEPLMQALEQDGAGVDEIAARMHVFYAEHFRQKGDEKGQLEHLEKGFARDPSEVDLLIARHRFPNATPEFRQKTQAAIQAACDRYEQEIRGQLQEWDSGGGLELADYFHLNLAQTYNMYAWLVANTDGDFAKALEYSRHSLEHAPGTDAYLDTLGRCYFAAGTLDQAIAYQQLACERAPHEQQIQRQLAYFLQQRAARPNPP